MRVCTTLTYAGSINAKVVFYLLGSWSLSLLGSRSLSKSNLKKNPVSQPENKHTNGEHDEKVEVTVIRLHALPRQL